MYPFSEWYLNYNVSTLCTFVLYNLRQHCTNASAHFGGSFLPILRFEKLEMHTAFLRFSNHDLTKNLTPNLFADLCSAALNIVWNFPGKLQAS